MKLTEIISLTHIGEANGVSWKKACFAQSSPMVGHSTQRIDCSAFTGSTLLPLQEGNVTLIVSNLILIFGLPER